MISITKSELKKMYETLTNKVICKNLGITQPTLVSYLKAFGIKQKGKGNKQDKRKIKLIK